MCAIHEKVSKSFLKPEQKTFSIFFDLFTNTVLKFKMATGAVSKKFLNEKIQTESCSQLTSFAWIIGDRRHFSNTPFLALSIHCFVFLCFSNNEFGFSIHELCFLNYGFCLSNCEFHFSNYEFGFSIHELCFLNYGFCLSNCEFHFSFYEFRLSYYKFCLPWILFFYPTVFSWMDVISQGCLKNSTYLIVACKSSHKNRIYSNISSWFWFIFEVLKGGNWAELRKAN